MHTDAYRPWSSKIVTFAIWALAAASAVYWGLKTSGVSAPAMPGALSIASAAPAGPQALARALGGALAAPQASAEEGAPAASRFALVGVVAARSQGGAALISIDGQEAQPVRVGSPVEGELVLESVTGRRAVLSSANHDGAKMTLELPALAD
jgi:general secretion pathway protein C